jgi:hypothetical protein
MGPMLLLMGGFLQMAECAIFLPSVTPYRRLVVFVLVIGLVMTVAEAPSILRALQPLLR